MDSLQPMCVDSSPNEDQNDLAGRARNGCGDAYTELAQRYFPRLIQLVLPRIRGSHMDAEDIAQESLARAFQNLDHFDPRYRFSTWLYTIAIRIAADHNRGRRRRMSLLEAHRTLIELSQTVGNSSTAECESREDAQSVWRTAHAVLPEAYYTAMWLRFAEDLSVEEIAIVMRKTKVGVRVTLHRARVKLLKELNKHEAILPVDQPRRSV